MYNRCIARRIISNVTFLWLLIIFPSILCWNHQEELELRKTLFKNYDKSLRPLKNLREVVKIGTVFYISSARQFDIVQGFIKVQAYITLKWCDDFLSWNTSVHNVMNITVATAMIWHPEIILCNTESQGNVQKTTHAYLKSDGCLEKVLSFFFLSQCEVDAYNFPFDKHTCQSILASVDYNNRKLVIENITCLRVEDLTESNWIIDIDCQTKNSWYSQAIIQLTLQRKIQAMSLSHLLPLIIFLLLNIMVGLLPVESGEKVSFATTVFLANIVYLGNINKELPKEPANVPLIFMGHLILTCLSGVSVISSIITSKRYFWKKSSELFALNKVGVENTEIQKESNGESPSKKAVIPEKIRPMKKTTKKIKIWFYSCSIESLSFYIMFLTSLIYAIVFVDLFSKSLPDKY